eukprot:TRINITY_DN10349_c0_g3_i1.p1 TRINITY_DN10349_c0_g3~~TRINITY_DN10349_c0_g3_i1.p1  ORF type:complete len:264 (-),score=54.51 TRINITY_DN10349_c0_g3_i1:270-1061(-)
MCIRDRRRVHGENPRKKRHHRKYQQQQELHQSSTNTESNMSSKHYRVEKIVGKKMIGRKPYYQVKWENYDSDQNTWEPYQNLKHLQSMIDQYEEAEKNPKIAHKTISKQTNSLTTSRNTRTSVRAGNKGSDLKDSYTDEDEIIKQAVVAHKKRGRPKRKAESDIAYGSFGTDEAVGIVNHAYLPHKSDDTPKIDNIYFKVEWKDRKDGTKPAACYYKSNIIKGHCPELLLEYYEQNAIFKVDEQRLKNSPFLGGFLASTYMFQ